MGAFGLIASLTGKAAGADVKAFVEVMSSGDEIAQIRRAHGAFAMLHFHHDAGCFEAEPIWRGDDILALIGSASEMRVL